MIRYITIFFIALSTLSYADINPGERSIIVKLPAELELILLNKINAKSVFSITEMAYKKDANFEILAADLSIEGEYVLKNGLKEGLMHMSVVFMNDDDGNINVYRFSGRVNTIVFSHKKDILNMIEKF